MIRLARRRAAATILLTLLTLAVSHPAFAQHDMSKMTSTDAWTWTFDGRVYLDENLQERKFTDFHQLESQNWFMAAGVKNAGGGRVFVHAMTSLEPFTLRKIGSAEVFQTGETYQGLPLIDFQHPHDLVMGAAIGYDHPMGSAWRWSVHGGPVDAPALGPEPFMHRASAENNPTAPLGHHNLDSAHISHDVITAGVSSSALTLEASAFSGREPDDHRIKLDLGPIDSYAARATWTHHAWSVQGSFGHLKFPDPTEFTDIDRTTASVAYTNDTRKRPIAALVAVGVNREIQLRTTAPAVLAEANWQWSTKTSIYARVEWVRKDILNAGGYDPPGLGRPHPLSDVGALTAGVARELFVNAAGHWRAGADVTVYHVDDNLKDAYGAPFSAHVLLSWAR